MLSKTCLSFFGGKGIQFFEENISGFFSTLWTSIATNMLKSKFQRAMKGFKGLCMFPAEEYADFTQPPVYYCLFRAEFNFVCIFESLFDRLSL